MAPDLLSSLRRVDDFCWEMPASSRAGMKVPGRIFASREMLRIIAEERALEQVANVATLPGIVGYSLAMPDIHWGYGFAIGGVAATRFPDGVVSPGGVGFDINCGVRLLVSTLTVEEVRPALPALMDELYRRVPSGVGSSGALHLSGSELEGVISQGAPWAIAQGYGVREDAEHLEENGCLASADPEQVSSRARQRGLGQLGTLGSGNHFLEVGALEEVYDREAATAFGLRQPGQVTVLIHTGSRGFGHQICQDFLEVMERVQGRYGMDLPDRQLACAPLDSPEGRSYLGAMACGANFAWANRQCIAHWVREAFAAVLGIAHGSLRTVYDVAHNIAKVERHRVEGREQLVCVHRKGATRAFPPGHPQVPEAYRAVGQPVIIPGDMGRYSYVAVGTQAAMERSFGSTCHGAGRVRSRNAARRQLRGVDLLKRLGEQGILARVQSPRMLAEEASEAYKDVAEVIEVVHQAGLSRKVARLRPIGVVKG